MEVKGFSAGLRLVGCVRRSSFSGKKWDLQMPKMRKKSDLPQKVCAGCGLPFSWRKAWARDWDAVRFCSDRCRKAGAKRQAEKAPR